MFLPRLASKSNGWKAFSEFDSQVLHQVRLDGVHVQGQLDFGLNEVQSDQKPLLGLDQWGVFADALREGPEDPNNLFALIVPQHLQLVVDLMAICGFDEGHRAGFGCAQCTSPHLPFVGAGNGQNPPVIQIAFLGVGQPVLLGSNCAMLCRTVD